MAPVFLYPLALFGLLGVPVLLAIYLLRNRYRRVPVSSLMLWVDVRQSREGGTRVRRLQMPLLLFLELLAVALLALAAAGPHVRTAEAALPLVVVLDDSFSMLAGAPDSPRSRAAQALEDELRRRPPYSVRFVLAGERPQTLGEAVRTAPEALARLDGWACRAPAARLEEAAALAAEVGGEWARVLVLTDHAPESPPGKGRLQWWAFGRPLPNLAFVNAARSASDGGERCLFEVANLSDDRQSATLVIEAGEPPAELRRTTLDLAAGATHREVLRLKEGTGGVRARIGEDALAIDNTVTLLPAAARTAGVGVRVRDKALRELVEKAVRAVKEARLNAAAPDVVFTDAEDDSAEGSAWLVRLLAEKDAEAFTGPFVLDRAHPLTEGLALAGVVWGAGKAAALPGAPVVMAGNVPLLTDVERAAGRHELHLRLRPDLSTLQDTPNWPVLVWNLLQWHASLAPGLARANVRLGEEAVLNLPPGTASAEVTAPDGRTRTVHVQGRRVVVRANDVGAYSLRTDEGRFAFAANALSRDESDLRACAAGRWGDWLDDAALRLEYRSVSWAVLLVLLAVVSLHLFLVARAGRPRT
jgi:hypothetical protein